MAISYGLGGVSWWSWQETNRREWRALGRNIDRASPASTDPAATIPALEGQSRRPRRLGAGAPEGAGESVPVTGCFGHKTRRAVKRFQRVNDFIDDGHIGAKTWHALLAVAPKTVNWSGRGSRHLATRSAGPHAPRSASLPAVRDEIPPASGR